MTERDEATGFENSIPILRVQCLSASLDHYVRVLGFRVDWQVPGTWVWMGVHDAGALFAELSASGATIRLPPTNYPWAYEMYVEDPDGHVLRLGSEPRGDRPFSAWIAWYRRDGVGV